MTIPAPNNVLQQGVKKEASRAFFSFSQKMLCQSHPPLLRNGLEWAHLWLLKPREGLAGFPGLPAKLRQGRQGVGMDVSWKPVMSVTYFTF